MPAVIERKVCIHCGTPFRPTAHRPDFCCAGCQFVHDLIAKNGLSQFYELQESSVQPVKSSVFQERDYDWLTELVAIAEKEATPMLQLGLQGISCIGCAWLVERIFSRKPGALAIRVDPNRGLLDLRWERGLFDVIAFAREVQSFGYLVGPSGDDSSVTNRSLVIRLGLCGALAMNTMLFTLPTYLGMQSDAPFAALFGRLSFLLATLSLVIGGSYFIVRSWHSLRQRVLHIDLPISMGLIAAYLGSVYAWSRGAHSFVYFEFVSTFTFLMLVGRWLQLKAAERNRNQLLAAQSEPPAVRSAETGEKLSATQLVLGQSFFVEPGNVIPVSARLQTEGATLGLEWINGESDARVAHRGSLVPSGAVNCGQHAVQLEAVELWQYTLLAELLRITPTSPPRNLLVERFIRHYIVAVVIIATLGFAGWWMAAGALLPALQVLISVLVVSCPCASGVALPLASDLAASRLRGVGVFIRESELWARLDRVRKIIFDKTGTLTLESISLKNPEALAALPAEERGLLLGMVHSNRHPVSGCLREQLLSAFVTAPAELAVREVIGMGLEAEHDGSLWRLGRSGWAATAEGDCIFSRDGEALASFCFGEEARADAAEELALLQKRHRVAVYILSGDRRAKVMAMAKRLGLPAAHCEGEMSPSGKAEWVSAVDAHDTLFLGDGANDSLAFDAAYCTGTPAIDRGLLELKADFYFLGRGLHGVRALLEMAVRRRRTCRAVIAFTILYNLFAVTLCLAGLMTPLAAAVLMPASSLVSLGLVFLGLRR